MAGSNGFTPIEKRILDILSDGQPHLRNDVIVALGDSEASRSALGMHLYRMRKKLNPRGQTILSTRKDGRLYIIHVRMLNNVE